MKFLKSLVKDLNFNLCIRLLEIKLYGYFYFTILFMKDCSFQLVNGDCSNDHVIYIRIYIRITIHDDTCYDQTSIANA